MFAGLYVNYECLKQKMLGLPVDISYSTASLSFGLYLIFALLFCNFFIRTYILSSKHIRMLSADINHNHYKGFVKKLQWSDLLMLLLLSFMLYWSTKTANKLSLTHWLNIEHAHTHTYTRTPPPSPPQATWSIELISLSPSFLPFFLLSPSSWIRCVFIPLPKTEP